MKKSTLIAGLGGAILLYLLNFLLYGMSGMMDGYATEAGAAIGRSDADMMHIHLALGHVIIGLALAHIYSKWARGTHNFMHGFQLGAWVGVAFGLGMNLIWYATADFSSLTGHLIDSVWAIISYGIACGVISILTDKFEEE
jgi:hypothetical protein